MSTRRRQRREGVLPTIGVLVEGETEYRALPLLRQLIATCPPLKQINLHGVGSDRKPIGIAKLVAPKVIELHAGGCERVVVCFDREQRADSAPTLARDVTAALAAELAKRGKAGPPNLHVVIADRAFEAWLLAGADELHAKGLFKSLPTFACFEGQLGAEGKKGTVELTRLLGREYGKTKDGPTLFGSLDIVATRTHAPGARGSRSFDKLLRSIGV